MTDVTTDEDVLAQDTARLREALEGSASTWELAALDILTRNEAERLLMKVELEAAQEKATRVGLELHTVNGRLDGLQQALGSLQETLHEGAENGESAGVRAWCAAALGIAEASPLSERYLLKRQALSEYEHIGRELARVRLSAAWWVEKAGTQVRGLHPQIMVQIETLLSELASIVERNAEPYEGLCHCGGREGHVHNPDPAQLMSCPPWPTPPPSLDERE